MKEIERTWKEDKRNVENIQSGFESPRRDPVFDPSRPVLWEPLFWDDGIFDNVRFQPRFLVMSSLTYCVFGWCCTFDRCRSFSHCTIASCNNTRVHTGKSTAFIRTLSGCKSLQRNCVSASEGVLRASFVKMLFTIKMFVLALLDMHLEKFVNKLKQNVALNKWHFLLHPHTVVQHSSNFYIRCGKVFWYLSRRQCLNELDAVVPELISERVSMQRELKSAYGFVVLCFLYH